MAFKMKGMEFGEGTGSPNKFLGEAVKGLGKALGGKEGIAKIAGGLIGGPVGAAIGGKLAGAIGKGKDKKETKTKEDSADPNAVSEEQVAQAKQTMKQNREPQDSPSAE